MQLRAIQTIKFASQGSCPRGLCGSSGYGPLAPANHYKPPQAPAPNRKNRLHTSSLKLQKLTGSNRPVRRVQVYTGCNRCLGGLFLFTAGSFLYLKQYSNIFEHLRTSKTLMALPRGTSCLPPGPFRLRRQLWRGGDGAIWGCFRSLRLDVASSRYGNAALFAMVWWQVTYMESKAPAAAGASCAMAARTESRSRRLKLCRRTDAWFLGCWVSLWFDASNLRQA